MENGYIIGVMSGTSLDGLDLVYTHWFGNDEFKILETTTIPYNSKWLNQLKNVANFTKEAKELKDLDTKLGKYIGNCIVDFIKSYQIKQVDLIASHGHTVHHQPEKGYTLQIGCGKEIFKKTGVKTVYDFRTQDVMLGGQGAPLVPIGDQLLFSKYDFCLNLGGFSNVSFDVKGVRKAFDICPVNTVLNTYSNKLGYDYDKDGELSKKGQVNKELLVALNNLPFYKSTMPKSLGVEFLNQQVYPLINKYNISEVDVLRTFVAHVAYQIATKINKGSVLVTGGGAYHAFLMSCIQKQNPNIKIVIPSKEMVEYKEALVFALLGKLKVENRVNCLASVTGAVKNHSSGIVVESL